ncbi:DEKNAAC105140 [Brettanomyces naardenensis]|uniref:Peptidyl-prolyl cis-trans isomerase n=1 Tax=Brettanomyces naardenensis TaxID=13370 RepID=A0A448YSN1_BRENA|nr:DEKNAAC105140 [Brettanomyces naardenensis]
MTNDIQNPYDGLPEGWTIRISRTYDQEYYYNNSTGESRWEPPEGTDEDKLNLYLSKKLDRPTKVRASHILVKHTGSRRPASWRQAHITRSKEEAIEIMKDYRSQILTGEKSFSDIAREFSDCNSHAKGGDLGFFGRGDMQPSVERAAFALQVGDMSDIVESDSGVHLIERSG